MKPPRWLAFLWPEAAIWLALMVLVALSAGLAFVPMGPGNLAAALLIAVVKGAFIVAVFMHLMKASNLLRLTGAGAILWLSLLFLLTFADVATRF